MMAGCGTPFQTTSRRGVDLLSFFHITRAEPKILKNPGSRGVTKMEALVAIFWVRDGSK